MRKAIIEDSVNLCLNITDFFGSFFFDHEFPISCFKIFEITYSAYVYIQTEAAACVFAEHFINNEGGVFHIVDKHFGRFAIDLDA